MYYIAPDHEWNPEPTFLDGDSLQLVDNLHIHDVENRSNSTRAQAVRKVVWRVTFTGIKLTHLSDFFGQSHACKQCFHSLFYYFPGIHLGLHGAFILFFVNSEPRNAVTKIWLKERRRRIRRDGLGRAM